VVVPDDSRSALPLSQDRTHFEPKMRIRYPFGPSSDPSIPPLRERYVEDLQQVKPNKPEAHSLLRGLSHPFHVLVQIGTTYQQFMGSPQCSATNRFTSSHRSSSSGASLNPPCGIPSKICNSTGTRALRNVRCMRTTFERNRSRVPAWRNVGGKPSVKFPNNGER
jgi:hypothetical protein